MLAPNSPVYGNLANATRRALAGMQRSVERTLETVVERSLPDGDGGNHVFASRLGQSIRSKQSEHRNAQNGMSYLQLQDSGLQSVGQIMDRMAFVAGQAVDSMLTAHERAFLVAEFEGLQESLFQLQNSSFQGHYLFQESVDFSSGLNEKNTTPTAPDTYEENVFSDDQRHYAGQRIKRWTSTKDVRYDRGKVTLKVNSGTAEERYFIRQGDNNVIFDTGWWETKGNAYTDDFDQFVVEYSPGEKTAYKFTTLDSDLDGNDDNSSYNKNASASGDYVENRWGEPITTRPAVLEETNLSIVIESKTLFQADAVYETVLSKDVMEIPVGASSVQVRPIQFSTLYDVSLDTANNSSTAAVRIIDEIEYLAKQRGQLGVSMRELEYAAERLTHHLTAEERSMERMDEGFVETSLELAKDSIRLESNLALATQARQIKRNLMRTLF